MDNIIFSHVTGWMLVAFVIGLALVFIYGAWKVKNDELKNGYKIKKYAKPTPLNIIYQGLTGFLMLLMIHEIGEKVMGYFGGEGAKEYHLFLAAVCGCLGGQIFALVIEKARLMLNVRDKEIAHSAKPELDQKTPLEAALKK